MIGPRIVRLNFKAGAVLPDPLPKNCILLLRGVEACSLKWPQGPQPYISIGVIEGFYKQTKSARCFQQFDLLLATRNATVNGALLGRDSIVTADQLAAEGTVNRVLEQSRIQEQIQSFLKPIAQNSVQALVRGKLFVQGAKGLQLRERYGRAVKKMEEDVGGFRAAQEGIRAFLQKRKPNFHDM